MIHAAPRRTWRRLVPTPVHAVLVLLAICPSVARSGRGLGGSVLSVLKPLAAVRG